MSLHQKVDWGKKAVENNDSPFYKIISDTVEIISQN